jgi:heat shock protein HslJ
MTRRALTLATVLAALLAVSACSPTSEPGADLVGTWRWTASQENQPPSQAVVPPDVTYSLTFAADGTLQATVDCNTAGGGYTVDGSNLTITLGATTLAACPNPDLDLLFTTYLGQVDSYAIAGDELTLSMADDIGTMTFTKGS